MLKKLKVKNFALMEELTAEFEEGFTVLTGETGAGKSILIDAIGYVLGNKFSRENVRTGEDTLYASLEFEMPEEITEKIHEKSEFIPELLNEENTLLIERQNSLSGKSFSKINGMNVSLQDIRAVSPFLLDIHGQHSSQNLLDPEKHGEYLDSFGVVTETEEFKNYSELYSEYTKKKMRLSELTRNNERDRLIDYLKFQVEEIKKAGISGSEEEDLLAREKMLSNSQKIADALKTAMESLSEENLSGLSGASRSLDSISDVFPGVKEPSVILEESYYNLTEALRTINTLSEEVYYSDSELDEVNSRLFIYDSLKRKYGETTEDILKFLKESEEKLFDLENAGEIIEKLKTEIREIQGKLLTSGEILMNKRKETAKLLSRSINENLKDVGLKKADFEAAVLKTDDITHMGIDETRFLISTNTGEPKKPLEKIVSGGELSRIMLALKSSFIDRDSVPTVIFDEIDTGISGRMAEAVGEKMYLISLRSQVFCVTHLPQIASFSDNGLIAEKREEKGRTFSTVKKAGPEDKILEVAKMLSGSEITDTIMENAREMTVKAQKIKEKIKEQENVEGIQPDI